MALDSLTLIIWPILNFVEQIFFFFFLHNIVVCFMAQFSFFVIFNDIRISLQVIKKIFYIVDMTGFVELKRDNNC